MGRVIACYSKLLGRQSSELLLLLVFFSIVSLPLLVSPVFSDTIPPAPIKIGVLAKRGEQRVFKKWNATADYLTRAIPGQRFEIVPLDFETVRVAAVSQNIDFLLTNSSYYVALEFDYGLSRIATMANLHDDHMQHVFGGVILPV